jgi:hypothetical protein
MLVSSRSSLRVGNISETVARAHALAPSRFPRAYESSSHSLKRCSLPVAVRVIELVRRGVRDPEVIRQRVLHEAGVGQEFMLPCRRQTRSDFQFEAHR